MMVDFCVLASKNGAPDTRYLCSVRYIICEFEIIIRMHSQFVCKYIFYALHQKT